MKKAVRKSKLIKKDIGNDIEVLGRIEMERGWKEWRRFGKDRERL